MGDRCGWALVGVGCLVLSGCGSTEEAPPPARSAGLNALLNEEPGPEGGAALESAAVVGEAAPETASLADQIALQAQRSFEVQSLLNEQPAPAGNAAPVAARVDDKPEEVVETAAAEEIATEPEPAPELTIEEQRAAMVDRLVALLADEAAGSADPYGALLGVAGLEALEPGTLEALRARDPEAFELLFDEQGEMLDSARRMLVAFGSGDRDRVASLARELAEELGQAPTLGVARLELCTKVDGFGRYTPFSQNRFVAGRAQPVIVYTELEGFAYADETISGGVEGFAVEVSQEVEIRHAADDLLAWRRSSGTVRDVSRNRVRDFYLVNEITLPSTLTVGRYTLKVITRDRNREGAVAERAVALEIVADPGLVSTGVSAGG